MIRIGDDLQVPASLGRPVATLGTFDGVHKGHQRVLADLECWAEEAGTSSLVVTFDRSPKQVTRGEGVPCITSLEHRLVLFERLGVDAAAVLRFDDELRRVPARAFVTEILVGRLGVRGLLLGFNCRFGRDGEGDSALLKELESEGLLEARQSKEPVTVDGEPVSSSSIREAIESGDLGRAERMLGRRVSLLGTVVRGRGRGHLLGFPTANLDLHQEVKPPNGVYVTETRLEGGWTPSLTSIGRKPTFPEPTPEDVVEVLIPDFEGSLYGRDLELRFGRKLREQVRFDSPEALVRQVREDVAALKGESE
jgi:riboflavin kinase/FMN adenylyltransferase